MKYANRTTRRRLLTFPKRKPAVLAVAVLATGLSVYWLNRSPATPPITPKVEAVDLTERTSLKPAAPEHVTRILVDRLNLEVLIEQVGLTKQGHVASPADIKKAGWYNKSSAPGTPGPTVIVGHYGSGAAFLEFEKLDAGDVLRIVNDKGQEFQYRLERKQKVPKDKVPMETILGYSRENRLEIITCSGRWLEAEQTFADRLLLTAEIIKEKERE